MGLAARLDQALSSRQLNPNQTPKEQVIRSGPKPDFVTLQEAIKNADSLSADDFGLRLVLVKDLGTEEIRLPMRFGNYTVDDVQKRSDGTFEVHIVENQK